jgi:glutamate synthase (NADPH/NADH) small chain
VRFLRCKLEDIKPPTGRKVAIIGAGPAGLGAAGILVCEGHEVHVYDQFPEPGGLMIFGIPEYHVPKAPVRRGISELRRAGVVFHTSTRVISCSQAKPSNGIARILGDLVKEVVCFEKLVEDYDAVLIATGAWRSRRLNIPGEELKGVYPALEWLVAFSLAQHGYRRLEEVPPVQGRLLVIGGGLTAVDAVEVPLKYLGSRISKVYLSYRRTRKEAPMGEREFNRLVREYGVEPLELTVPVRFEGDERGWVRKVVLQRTRLEPTPSGRPRPVPIPGSEFEIQVDAVLVAIGEQPSPPFEGSCCGIELNPDGTVKVDEKYRTTARKVFAAGDVKHGPSLIGPALKSGIEAAKYINEFLATL